MANTKSAAAILELHRHAESNSREYARAGMGKRGGARVITYVINADGKVWRLTAYAKAALDNLSAAALVKLRKELIDG